VCYALGQVTVNPVPLSSFTTWICILPFFIYCKGVNVARCAMIVLSDDDRRQLKSPAVPLPALRTPHQLHGTTSPSGSSVHLPDYEASQLEANVLPRPVSNTSILGETSLTRSRRRKWARLDGRLWKAVCYAFGFYVLLTVILGVPFIVVRQDINAYSPLRPS
jgi:hypothetical protein